MVFVNIDGMRYDVDGEPSTLDAFLVELLFCEEWTLPLVGFKGL